MERGEEPSDLLRAALDRKPLFDLLEARSVSTAELQTSLDVSRSTAHRVTTRFEEAGLIRYENGAYELTVLGGVVAEEIRRAERTVSVAQRLSPLLPTLAVADASLDFRTFADAEVVTPQAADPHRPIRRLIHTIEGARSVRELCPTMPDPAYLMTLWTRITDGLCASIVFPRQVADRLRETDDLSFEVPIDSGSLDVRIAELPPFRLLVADDSVSLIAYNDDGSHLRLVVDTNAPKAFDWATSFFQERWEEATPYGEAYDDAFTRV